MKKILTVILLMLSQLCFAGVNYTLEDKVLNLAGSGKDAINLGFKGRTFTKPGLAIDGGSKDLVAQFIHGYIQANISGDKKVIAEFWRPNERAELQSKMADDKAFSNNSAFFKNIKSSHLMAVMSYGEYFIAYVDHDLVGSGHYIKTYPLYVGGNRIMMTNNLMKDFFFSQLSYPIGAHFWGR